MKSLVLSLCALSALMTSAAVAGESGLHVVDTIKIGGDGGWDYVNYDAVSKKVFLTHGTSIASVALATKTVNPHLTDVAGAHIALPLGDGKTLLITQGKANKASFIDAETGADLGDVATGAKPDGAIFDPATNKVFVLANGGNQIDVVDPVTRKSVGTVALAGAPESGAADGKGLLYTHLEDKNVIVVVDTKAMRVKATYPLKDCDEPSGLALVGDQNLLLSACKNGIARISRAADGSEVGTVAIGPRADGALYDETRKLGYVPSADGKLTVIAFDGKPHVIDVVETAAGARTAALDPATGTIFLPAADMAPPAKAGDRPQPLPGTFKLVVVGK